MIWRRMQLKQVASVSVSNVDKKSAEHERQVRLCNYVDVYKNDLIDASLDFMQATASPSQIRSFGLRAGDTVITKDSETADDIAIPAYVAETIEHLLCGYHLAVVRPGPEVDPKYLFWSLSSQPMREQAAVAATGVTRFGLRQESIRNVRLDLPSLDEQRRIANFLDAETTRIDRLIDLRQRQVVLLDQRPWSLLRRLVTSEEANWLPLRRALVFLSDGPFGSAFSSSDYVSQGAAVVRLGNIGFASYRHEAQACIPTSVWATFPRCHVKAGDLLLAGLGDANNHAGRACVAPDLGDALVKGKCFVARVDERVASARYLALLLSSSVGRDVITVEAQGSTRAMINLEIVKSAVLPIPPRSVQDRVVDAVEESSLTGLALRSAAFRQVALLTERRQALVTAAVTGQLDVTTARGAA